MNERLSSLSDCPTPERLAECLEPLSSDDHQIDVHLANCPSCRATLDWLAGDASWWKEACESLAAPWVELSDTQVSERGQITRIIESVCALTVAGGDAAVPQDPLQHHELEQLSGLLEPACHPELLGRIGRYELEQLVGRGGMGLVFRGYDTELHRVVAVKTLAIHLIPIASARKRFVREARACASLIHPHIVPVHDVITDGPAPAIVMQYVAGPTLEEWLAEHGALGWRDTLQIGIQLADALRAAHENDLVHRDIKPGNVLLEAQASRALLTDFGLVRALDDATLTHSAVLAGTPDFMSPEQARGEAVDHRSDLFSLGSVMYTMLCGVRPFQAPDAMAVMNRICHTEIPSPAGRDARIPKAVSDLVMELLEKQPNRRPQSAVALRDRLRTELRRGDRPGKRKSARVLRQFKRHPTGSWLIVGCVFALATCLAAWPLGMWPTERSVPPVPTFGADREAASSANAGKSQSESYYLENDEMRRFDAQIRSVEREVEMLRSGFPTPRETAPTKEADSNVSWESAIQSIDREIDRLRSEWNAQAP